MRKTLIAIVAAITVMVGGMVTTTAEATPGEKHEVTICHANANSWVEQTVDIASIAKKSGHAYHQDGRDIIPPFEAAGKVEAFPGLNWDAAGQAIFANGCAVPAEPDPSPTPSEPTVTPDPDPSETPDPEPSPEPSEATPTEEPSEDPEPTQTPTNEPSPDPSKSPTEPTEPTESETPTPEPSETPEPSVTPEPTTDPEPTLPPLPEPVCDAVIPDFTGYPENVVLEWLTYQGIDCAEGIYDPAPGYPDWEPVVAPWPPYPACGDLPPTGMTMNQLWNWITLENAACIAENIYPNHTEDKFDVGTPASTVKPAKPAEAAPARPGLPRAGN